MKYLFYELVIFLLPASWYRFFHSKGDYSFDMIIKYLITCGLIALAYWSHSVAKPPADPGWLKWEDFRTPEQLKDTQDKLKWQDPEYVKRKQTQKYEDPEDINKYSNQCQKCGCMKVDGVHHCSQCKRCVYKMDHHCPWTGNCVGYYTLKPFLLFLLYVSALTFCTVAWMYMAARKHMMLHISLIAMMPSSQLKYMLTMRFCSAEERRMIIQDNKLQYELEKSVQGDPDDIFSWTGLKEVMSTFRLSRNNPLYSMETFYDFIIFILTFTCGCYTLFLFFQTLWYVQTGTSLVDSHKRDRYYGMNKNDKKDEKGKDYLKIKPTLNYQQVCQAILGEDSISLKSFIPVHDQSRMINNVRGESGKKID